MMAICLSMIFGEMMMIQKMLNREPTRQRRMENLKGKNPDHLRGRHPGRGLARGIERRELKDRDPEVLLEVPGPEVVLEVVESLVADPGEALHQVPHQDLQEGLAEATHGQDRVPDPRTKNPQKGPAAPLHLRVVDRPGADLALGIGQGTKSDEYQAMVFERSSKKRKTICVNLHLCTIICFVDVCNPLYLSSGQSHYWY